MLGARGERPEAERGAARGRRTGAAEPQLYELRLMLRCISKVCLQKQGCFGVTFMRQTR